jgi:pimeloyl-ACP methyl ester carboxylesterase
MWDLITHKWLRVPYTLHVATDQKVKKPRATVLFVHGIGNSGSAWDEVIEELPKDVRLVSIDLLGFGESQRPTWAVYSAKTQARAVLATYLRLRIKGQVIVVGHSLGSLVAVEIAKRYPLLVRSMVLCSPPFYKADPAKWRLVPSGDHLLKDIYKQARRRPEELIALSGVAMKLGLVNKSFSLTRDNAPSYISALESSIINQTSLEDAIKINTPIQLIYGRLDPVVLYKNLRYLAEHNQRVHITNVLAGHEVRGLFVPAVVKAIKQAIEP